MGTVDFTFQSKTKFVFSIETVLRQICILSELDLREIERESERQREKKNSVE